MFTSNASTLLIVVVAIAALVVLGYMEWRRRHRKSPAERERARRLAVNATGRLTDGALIETSLEENSAQGSDLIFYRYRAAGLEYTAAQDVSALRHLIAPQTCRPGAVTAVKYDARKPSNSIVICEQWSGFRHPQKEDDPHRKLLARQH